MAEIKDRGRDYLRVIQGGDGGNGPEPVEPWRDPMQCVDCGPEDCNAMGELIMEILRETTEGREHLRQAGLFVRPDRKRK